MDSTTAPRVWADEQSARWAEVHERERVAAARRHRALTRVRGLREQQAARKQNHLGDDLAREITWQSTLADGNEKVLRQIREGLNPAERAAYSAWLDDHATTNPVAFERRSPGWGEPVSYRAFLLPTETEDERTVGAYFPDISSGTLYGPNPDVLDHTTLEEWKALVLDRHQPKPEPLVIKTTVDLPLVWDEVAERWDVDMDALRTGLTTEGEITTNRPVSTRDDDALIDDAERAALPTVEDVADSIRQQIAVRAAEDHEDEVLADQGRHEETLTTEA